ncbi:MAG: DUF6537 domain-containing protein, partial [Halieaceae bacterium]
FANNPDEVLAELAVSPTTSHNTDDIDDLIADRRARLEDYQGKRYGQRYQKLIDGLRSKDMRAEEKHSVTAIAARELYRRMAIKDEYEVARLYS